MSGCGSGESRWPHCPAGTPPASSIAGLDRRASPRAFGEARRDTRVSVRTIPEADARRPARPLPFARPWNPSPGRAPPCPPTRSSSTRRSRCSWPRSRSGLRGRLAGHRSLERDHLALLLLESLPLIVRRRFPLAVLGDRRGRHDGPPRAPPGGPVADRGWASSSRSTPSASASTAVRRSIATTSTAALLAIVRRPGRRRGGRPDARPDRAGLRRRVAARRRDADPPAVRGNAGGACAAARAGARGAGRAGRARGTRADRPRAPRRRHPPRQRDGDPGGRRGARHRQAARRGAHGARGDRDHRSAGADRHAPDARDPRRAAGDGARCPASTGSASCSSRCGRRGWRSSWWSTGERRALDPGLEVSAYRIIQEALTNSLRHAGGGRARVARPVRPDALEIDGRGRARAGRAGRRGAGPRGSRPRSGCASGWRCSAGRSTPIHRVRVPGDRPPAGRRRGVGSMSIRVLLVDDQQLVRTGFRMILSDEAEIEVVGEASNGREAVELAARLDPTSSSWTSGCR